MKIEHHGSDIEIITLDALAAHPLNSNVMKPALLDKLVEHIARTDRYPPIIVRPLPPSDAPHPSSHVTHQLLDGHHRVAALRRLGRGTTRCVVWEVDDAEALLLLATLNRLEGEDDPRKRGRLLAALRKGGDWPKVAAALPESKARLDALCALTEPTPTPVAPMPLERMPVAVHFFLLPEQRRMLEARLRVIGGGREDALMQLVASDDAVAAATKA